MKGRKRRLRKLGIVEAITRVRMERMRVVKGFSLKNVLEFDRISTLVMVELKLFMYFMDLWFLDPWLTSIQG